uniref:Ras-related protein Rab n=1 Tax=Panagrolaimus sp. ES5 TaxID=591445 RepID=A0AC34F183_9BILA
MNKNIFGNSDTPRQVPTPKNDLLFKILVIGDVSTGKSSVIRRYVHNIFESHYKATIGVDFATKIVQWNDNRLIRLQFWDISGQDRFGNMTRVYYKDAHGAIIVADCSRRATLEGALRWKNDLDNKVCLANGRPVPAVLLSNKCDLESHITDDELSETVLKNGFKGFFKVSAKNDIQIEESIHFLAEQVIRTEDDGQYGAPIYLRDAETRRLSAAAMTPEDRRSRKKTFHCC